MLKVFLEKGLGIVSPAHFVHDLLGKLILMLSVISHLIMFLLTEQISLPHCFYFLR